MSCINLQHLRKKLPSKTLVENAVDFAVANGIIMKAKDSSGQLNNVIHAPFTLFPTKISKHSLEHLYEIQLHINYVVHRICQDEKFLTESLDTVVNADDFTKRLFDIYKLVKSTNRKVSALGCLRSDYMFDSNPETCHSQPKQIEINTIASGLMGIGTHKMKELHSKILSEMSLNDLVPHLSGSPSAKLVAEMFVKAWQFYGNNDAVIVILIDGGEYNIYDQRAIEYEIYNINPKIHVRRKVFKTLHETMELAADGTLSIDNEEVSIVYFRVAYMPHQYPSEQVWKTRTDIELSRAIKCPSVAQQLVGAKKMQEILARPGVLERFVDKEAAAKIGKTFTGLYTLDMGAEGDSTVKMALADPDKFVLKPQREGGGNNLYGNDITTTLSEIGQDERRASYILMDRIRPRPTPNYIVAGGSVSQAELVSELGVFGVYLSCGDGMIDSCTAGHLLRSKSKEHDQGGVSAGVAVLDSVLLLENDG